MFISKKIKYFMMVAKELSFKNASEKLCLSAPPVSKGINDLEQFLGYDLFIRKKCKIQLTKKGQALYENIYPIILELETLQSTCKKNESPTISIGLDGFYFHELNRIIKNIFTYSKRQVDIISGESDDLKDKYKRGDLSIFVANYEPNNTSMLEGDFIDLGTDSIKIAINAELYKSMPDINEILRHKPLIQLSRTITHNYFKKIHEYRIANSINTPILSVSEVPTVTSLINEKVGVSFVSETVKNSQNFSDNGLILVEPPIDDLFVRRRIYVRNEEFILRKKLATSLTV